MKIDFNLISTVSIIAPVIAGAFLFRGLKPITRTLYWLVFFTFLAEIPTRLLYEKQINNMFLFHLQSYIEFYFLLAIYYRLYRELRHQRFALITGAVFLMASLIMLFRDSIFEFNTGQRYVEMLLLVLLFFAYLREQHIYNSPAQIRKNPFFWFTVGYLIYFAGTLLLFLSQDMFVKNGHTEYWIIHGIFNIFLNLVFTFVLWSGGEKSLS